MKNKAIHGGDIYRNQVRLDFSVNVNPLGMPDGVEEALHEAVSSVQEYPDMEALALKESLAEKLAVPEEKLLFGNGASELLMAVVHALHPTKIMIPSPSFYGYQHAAKAEGSKVIPLMLKEENGFLLTEELFTVLEQERPELLILANPNNPTGVLTSKEYLKQLLGKCRKTNTFLLLDECFIEFCEGQDTMLSEIGKEDRLLLLRAFTKSFAIPGWQHRRAAYKDPGAASGVESVGFCPKGRTGMPFFGKRSLPYRDRPPCEKGAAVSYRGTTTNGDPDIPRRSELSFVLL